MLKLLYGNRLARSALVVALLLSFCSAYLFTSARPALAADAGDNYPWSNATSLPSGDWGYAVPCPTNDTNCTSITETYNRVTYGVIDPWGYYLRYCTSWAAWAVHDRDGVDVPHGLGNAKDWANNARADGITVDTTPVAGAVAQWNAYPWNGVGHVDWVETVNSPTSITVEDYNFSNPGAWDQRTITKGGTGSAAWPDNIIHFGTVNPPPPPTPTAPVSITRNGNTMTVFYNDGASHLKAWYWDVNAHPSWWSGSWDDNIVGQPSAIARDDGDMDVFYHTADNRLRHIAWNVNIGWGSPETLVKSDVVGDVAVAARDSGHMSVFYRTAAGEIKFVSWDSSQVPGWNLNPQRIYGSSATGDPAAVSRSASTYDVFFVKNNGNLVHLAWDSCCGWSTEDWTANMMGRPSAIARNSGGHMSVFYRESNGNVAERFWDLNSGWGVQDWPAQLAGDPNAVVLDNGDVEVYYRETGGNVVDRYWSSVNGWGSTWITGTGTSTGDPWGIRRGTNPANLEVHYWNGSSLMDTNWSFGHPWTTSVVTNTP